MTKETQDSNIYQALFQSSIDGIVIINDHGLIQDVNNAILEVFGYDKNDLIGENVSMLMGSPHKEAHDSYLERYQRTKEARIIGIGREVEARKKNGDKFPIRLAVSEFRAGGSSFYTGVIHDLSEENEIKSQLKDYNLKLEAMVEERTALLSKEIELRSKTQLQLVESQKLYEAIANNFPNGTIGVLDQDLNILFMEGTELKNMGFDSNRLLGENYIKLLPKDVRSEVEQNLKKVLNGEQLEFEIKTGDRVYMGRSVPLPNEKGVIDKILQVDINITKEKNAEEEIYNALMKEKQLNELKSNFVSMASHEFRTPLSSILSSASLVKRYDKEEQQVHREKHLNKIIGNVKNLNLILNDFLSLEKIESDLIKNKPTAIDLENFLDDVLEETGPLRKKDQRVEKEVNLSKDQYELDAFLLRNVLNNLLSNAYKYSKEGDMIMLKCYEDNGLVISIEDQGIGIAENEKDQLFSRFFRASNALNIQGTGLGLNIVKRYVNIMAGEISFESTLNQGSKFTLRF